LDRVFHVRHPGCFLGLLVLQLHAKIRRRGCMVKVLVHILIFGFVQFVHWVSSLTLSVLMAICSPPLPFARTAKMSDIGLRRSTIVLSFWRDGRIIWTYRTFINMNALRYKKSNFALTSGSGHNGSFSLSTSLGFMTSILTSWLTLTPFPNLDVPLISKLNTA
jgi:hypothetical protein